MNQKRNREQLDRSTDLMGSGTSPGGVGDGYGKQLANMQELDRQR